MLSGAFYALRVGRGGKKITAVIDEFNAPVDAQLVEDVCDMCFHSAKGNIQGGGDVPVGVPCKDQLY